MFEILITVILAVTTIVLPTKPYANFTYIADAKTNSLASSALIVSVIPDTPYASPEKSLALNENEGDRVDSDNVATSSPEAIIELIVATFPQDPIMLEVAKAESGLNPKAKNPNSSATGIFQILSGTWKHFSCEGEPVNAKDNILCAKKVLDGQGLGAWQESYPLWKNF